MSQLKFYKTAAIGFFILNIVFLSFFFFTRPKPHGGRGWGKNDAQHILHLDAEQNEVFLKLAEQHIEEMKKLKLQQKELLEEYFKPLLADEQFSSRDTALLEVQLVEQRKVESTYQHFEDVKAMLKPEQEVYFKEFVKGALGRILLKKGNQPPPRKD